MKKKILLVGGGDFTKKVIRLVNQFADHQIIGYTDLENKGELFGIKYLGKDQDIPGMFPDLSAIGVIICIAGNISLIKKKLNLISFYNDLGCFFPTIISKKAHVDKDANLGQGVLIFDYAYLDFNVRIGNFSIINLMVLICHDVDIGSNITISPKSIVAGGTKINNDCFIGSNATINPYIEIAKNTIIGSGAVVNKSIFDTGVYVGNPLKKVK